jgi:hypothetical protein
MRRVPSGTTATRGANCLSFCLISTVWPWAALERRGRLVPAGGAAGPFPRLAGRSLLHRRRGRRRRGDGGFAAAACPQHLEDDVVALLLGLHELQDQLALVAHVLLEAFHVGLQPRDLDLLPRDVWGVGACPRRRQRRRARRHHQGPRPQPPQHQCS